MRTIPAISDLTTADHRRILERLGAEFTALMGRRRELGALAVAIMLEALALAMTPHMRAIGVPDAHIANMLRLGREASAAVDQVRTSVGSFLKNFQALEAADPKLAQRLVLQFAEVGRFIVAERRATVPAPMRRQ